jgi:cell division protein FtsL
MSGRLFGAWLVALLLLLGSGIQVAYSAHEVRRLHVELQTLQAGLDRAVEQYSRLQIEMAAVAAFQNVERTAEQALDMRFPERVQRVKP